jgi:hypothetical protein
VSPPPESGDLEVDFQHGHMLNWYPQFLIAETGILIGPTVASQGTQPILVRKSLLHVSTCRESTAMSCRCTYLKTGVPQDRRSSSILLRVSLITITVVGTLQMSPLADGAATMLIPAPGAVDFVEDSAHGVLYISSGSQVLRFDLGSEAFLRPFDLGGSLSGIDMSPDGTHLLVADSTYTTAEAWFYDVNPASGAGAKITYSHDGREAGAYQIRFACDGTALLSSRAAWGSGDLPIRQYDPTSGSLAVVNSIYQGACIGASADRSVVAVSETGTSPSTILRYRAATKDFVSGYTPSLNLYSTGVAVSHDASQIVAFSSEGTSIYDANWNLTARLDRSQIKAPIGMVYDSCKNLLYDSEIYSTCIDVYDAGSWQKINTYSIPYTFTFASGSGRLRTSDDGDYLFVLAPGSGIYAIHVPEPATMTLLLVGGACLLVLVWRKRE